MFVKIIIIRDDDDDDDDDGNDIINTISPWSWLVGILRIESLFIGTHSMIE